MTSIDEIIALGWKILPVAQRGKRPLVARWPELASDDPDQVAQWGERFPGCNWGLKLGPDSGVVDVECDDQAAEDALGELFGGDLPVTPIFKSSRGSHRIFRYNQRLPDKAVVFIDKLEIRIGGGGQGAQSLIPPSIHPTGAAYEWLPGLGPDQVDPPEIPPELLEMILASDRGVQGAGVAQGAGWRNARQGVGEGQRNQSAASFIGRLLTSLRDPFNLEEVNIQFDLVAGWNARNDPPLDMEELAHVFDSILAREQKRRNDQDFHEHFSTRAIRPVEKDSDTLAWRMKIVNGRPRIFLLYSPLWSGAITLSSNQVMTPRLVMIQALEQKNVVLDRSFPRLWNGDRGEMGICARVVETAEEIEPDIEQHRDLVVARMVQEEVDRAVEVMDGKDPDGSVQVIEGGEVVFRFGVVHERLAYSVERITRLELSRVLRQINAQDYRNRSLKKLDQGSLRQLSAMLNELPQDIANDATTAK